MTRRDGISAASILLLSIVHAFAIVWGAEWLSDSIRGRSFGMGEELGPRWVRTALALAPFALFALWVAWRRPANARGAWLAGLVVSVAFWAWYYFDGLTNTGGGANIGLGIVMMVLPLPVFVVMWWLARRR